MGVVALPFRRSAEHLLGSDISRLPQMPGDPRRTKLTHYRRVHFVSRRRRGDESLIVSARSTCEVRLLTSSPTKSIWASWIRSDPWPSVCIHPPQCCYARPPQWPCYEGRRGRGSWFSTESFTRFVVFPGAGNGPARCRRPSRSGSRTTAQRTRPDRRGRRSANPFWRPANRGAAKLRRDLQRTG